METEKQLSDAIAQCDRMIKTIHSDSNVVWQKKQKLYLKRENVRAAYGDEVAYVMNEQCNGAYQDIIDGLRTAGRRVRDLRDYLVSRRQTYFPNQAK